MKKSFMPILWGITIICIIVGATIHVGGFFGRLGSELLGISVFSAGKDVTPVSSSEQYTGIQALDMELDLANVIIRQGDELDISYEGAKELAPVIKTSGEKLIITQTKSNKVKLNSLKQADNSITITVPSDGKMTDISVDIDLGNLEISDVSCDKLDLDMSLGSVQLKAVTASEIRVQNDMGNIEAHEPIFEKMDMDCDMGNITLSGIGDMNDYRIEADCSLGSVSINGDSVSNKYSAGKGDKTITLKADMGNVEIFE